ncbi:MAG: hypothetical protein IJ516_06195 [Phascolarctobacterium sp.]|nr:hypothetical protein [Phascolarctobacterium sp.]
MTMDERQRNFRAAKQEVKQQQQATEAQQEKSETEELNMKHVADILANKQLTDIHKAIEKLGKQNENLQARLAESLQVNLQHYLDVNVAEETKEILEKHTKKTESIQADIEDSLRIINEKLILVLGGFAIIIIMATGFVAYRYFIR